MNETIAPAVEVPIKDYRAPLRFWHWGNAALITLQLITILFQKVIVNSKSAVPEFQQALSKDSVAITAQQGRAFAHIISERIWDWHKYFGWAIVAFFVLRVFLQLIGPSELRFSARLMEIMRRYRLAPPANKSETGKILFAKTTYALFYLFLTIMVVTGLILIYEDVSFLRPIHHLAEETHNVTMYLIIGFIVLHVVGVVWAEIKEDNGLISRMIGGNKVPKQA
ncbi:cytochrome b/b6 domain-containing protein [Hymenobacter negativus]|uniref:Cytochrome b/b6 domain-containing protein n=1 Tax=Hymenobacter negativus TaxID=2795026 RepID=A0ABS3QL19_9BACT|nr:cytochrome b/b6 domain-containing protein [Hymenobacter negativus]MBO2011927.1 cytochrome b/b6 domain-containing protein [Hymenobacter negativus]